MNPTHPPPHPPRTPTTTPIMIRWSGRCIIDRATASLTIFGKGFDVSEPKKNAKGIEKLHRQDIKNLNNLTIVKNEALPWKGQKPIKKEDNKDNVPLALLNPETLRETTYHRARKLHTRLKINYK